MTNRTPGDAPSRWRWHLPMLMMAAVLGLIAAMASPIAASAQTAAAPQPAPDRLKPTVKDAVKHDALPSLSNVRPTRHANQSTKTEVVPIHEVPHGQLAAKSEIGSAKVQSDVVTNSMPSFDQNFEGVGNVNGVLPADTQGTWGNCSNAAVLLASSTIAPPSSSPVGSTIWRKASHGASRLEFCPNFP